MCIYISIYIFFIPSKDSRDNPDPILSHLGCDLRPSMLESGGFLEPVNVFWNFNPPTFRIKTRVMWVPTPTHTNVYDLKWVKVQRPHPKYLDNPRTPDI